MDTSKPTGPIRRSPALVPLSRDHHQGLLLCWKIRQGLKGGVEEVRIASYVRHFFAHDLESHFSQEEDYIFPLLPADHPQRQTAETQHAELRAFVAGPNLDESAEALNRFAAALDAHIRFEERTLFGTIEQTASPASLEEVNEKLAAFPHGGEPAWDDQFWIKKKTA